MSKVSVIIPNYNQSRYVGQAIQSALDQTYRDSEIIVIDDGSTDDSRRVLDGFAGRIRVISQENQGLAGARNTGIRAAVGELIGLLDADDQWRPDFLREMMSLVMRHPEAAVFYCSAQAMDQDGIDLPQIFGGLPVVPDRMYQTLLRANFLIPSTIIMRRSIIAEAGFFDQELRSCEDLDLWLRILPKYSFYGTSDCLARYRIHDKSLSADPAGMQGAQKAVVEKHFGPDDGAWQSWPKDKRQAYGGLYCFYLLTALQRQGDWRHAPQYLRRALQIDRTLSRDLNLFYDLVLGDQPLGYRGTLHRLNLEENAAEVHKVLSQVFAPPIPRMLRAIRSSTYGTVFYALGLVAYNVGYRSLSRKYFVRALFHRPDLLFSSLVIGNFFKSFLSRTVVEKLKRNKP